MPGVDPDFDPFDDSDDHAVPVLTVVGDKEDGPVMEHKDNWVSFSFLSDGGYDKLAGTVHGDPDYVAGMFGITGFDGRVSTLMKKAITIDKAFKRWAAEATPGKG